MRIEVGEDVVTENTGEYGGEKLRENIEYY